MNITKMSSTELKSLAYDTIANIEKFQNNLKIINAEILERSKEQQEAPKPITTTELKKSK